ncbi:MAG: hypothetical protein ACRC2R_01730 [Xenococcaceae cyanobacterium]
MSLVSLHNLSFSLYEAFKKVYKNTPLCQNFVKQWHSASNCQLIDPNQEQADD